MTFSVSEFVRHNKRLFIWAAMFIAIYLIVASKIFALMFITFVLCYLFAPLIQWMDTRTRFPRRFITVALYVVFLAVVITVLSFVLPRLVREATSFFKQLPTMIDTIHLSMDRLAASQPQLEPGIKNLKQWVSLEPILGVKRDTLVSIALKSLDQITGRAGSLLLGVLFSFLILLDLPRLETKAKALRHTRIRVIYEEVVDLISSFAMTLGTAFRAQIVIAFFNTLFTAVGLIVLDIQPMLLLSTIVFLAGLIPVLGTFISSVPIILVAFNIDGLPLAMWALGLILVIHAFENYVINPKVFSTFFKLSPVATLIILYIAYHFMGLWGMLLGVPITVFVYRCLILGERMNHDVHPPLELDQNDLG